MAKRIAANQGKAFQLKNKKLVELTPSPSTAPATCATVSSGFSATPGTNQATIAWGDTGASSYNVQYRQQGTTTWTSINTTNLNVTITGLSSQTTYQWQVQSVCDSVGLTSAFSATQQFTTTTVTTGNLVAGFYRNAKVADYITPGDFSAYGRIDEGDIAANTQFKAAKMFCDSDQEPLWEKVSYDTGISGTRDWIKWRSNSTDCASGPWFARWQLYRDNCECSTIAQEFTPSQELFMDAYYWFPDTSTEDPPEPDWVANIGGKMSPGVTGISGVGNTGGNPQTDGKHEGTFHWYGLKNSKKDRRNSVHKSTTFTITKFEIGWSVYEADTRTAGNKYQQDYFFCESAGTTRKVFDKGIEYRFRGMTRLNTPGELDGIYFWQVSEDGGTWEDVLNVTDANQQGNFDTPYGRAGMILFRGGDSGSWLVGNSSDYPTTVHDTFIYVRHYFLGTFPGMTVAPGLSPVQDSNMFSFIPDDKTNGEAITNVLWEIKNAATGSVLYSGNGAPATVSKTGNFYHGRYIWPVIDLGPAFVSTSGGDVQVCKTITTASGTSAPFCITYSKGLYDDNTPVPTCTAPAGLTANPAITTATLSWNSVSGASGYEISYKEQSATNYVTLTSSSNSVTITGLVAGTTYNWYVKSVCGSGTSGTSSVVSFTTNNQNLCNTPTGLSAVPSDVSAILSWSNTSPSSGYDVQYRVQGSTIWLDLVDNATANTYTVLNLTPGTTYEWRVRSDCGATQSSFSVTSTFTTTPGTTVNGNVNVLMSVDNAASPSTGDANLKTILENTGNYTVTYVTDNDITVSQAEGYDLVIFGPSSTSHGSTLKWAKVNILFTGNEDVNPMWVAGSTHTNTSNSVQITDNSHPVTSDFSIGTLQISTTSSGQKTHNSNAQGLVQLATTGGNNSVSVMEAGAARTEWWSFGRIAVLSFNETIAQNLNANGQQLFINACDWTSAYNTAINPDIPPHGLVDYQLDGTEHRLIASRSLDHPNATYVFELSEDFDTDPLLDVIFSRVPSTVIDTNDYSLTTLDARVRQSIDDSDFKIVICDATSGFNHNHGDEAENLFDDLIDALNLETNTTFTVVRDNSIVTSDDLLDYDMLVLASTTGYNTFDSDTRSRIEAFTNKGGSVISIHAAADAYYHSSVDPNYNTGGGSTGGGNTNPNITLTGPIKDADIVIFHFDGDTQDDDDIAALPIAALLVASAGIASKTHFFIGNNLNEGDTPWQVTAMRNSAAFAEKLGITIHDYTADVTGSNFGLNDFSNVRAELVALLSSGGKVVSLEGGPMEAIYRGLDDTPVQYHSNITLISHSTWNEQRKVLNAPGAVAARDWDDCKTDFPNVTFIDIIDQNANYFEKNSNLNWVWMDSATYQVFKDGRAAMMEAGFNTATKVNDASDAGMMWYGLFNSETGTVLEAKAFMEANLPVYVNQFTEREPGVYTFQASHFDISGSDWEVQTIYDDYTGDNGYLQYTGSDSLAAIPAASVLTTTVDIQTAGTYQIIVKSRIGSLTDPSQENDHWIQCTDADDFYAGKTGSKIYAKGNPYGALPVTSTNDSVDGYLKFYNNNIGVWSTQTSAIDNNKHNIFATFNSPGTYTIKVAARSNNYAIDTIILKEEGLLETVVNPYIQPYTGTLTGGGTTGGGTLDQSNGVWDYYPEYITGVSIQRSPNHTNNNTTATLTKLTTTEMAQRLTHSLPASWSHDEEYFYWGPKTSNYTGYLDLKFTEVLRVSSTGGNSYDIPRMMAQYYEHPGGGLMFYTALGHNSSTWNSDTEFRALIDNALRAAYVKTRFSTAAQKVQNGALSSVTTLEDSGIGASTFYISATPSGLADGSDAANAMSFDAAKLIWNSGPNDDTYLFKRGDVFYVDDFTITSGGVTSGQEMTFGAYGTGPKPKFKGTGATSITSSWSQNPAFPPSLFNVSRIGPAWVASAPQFKALYLDGRRIKEPRSEYRYADGGSGSQLVDNNLETDLPLTHDYLQADPSAFTVHWKADLYTWEWDTIDASYTSGSTYPFASGSHTTGVSTTFPYYLQGTPELMLEGEQEEPYVAFMANTYVVLRTPNNVDPNTVGTFEGVISDTGINISASNIYIRNLDIDMHYREGIYLASGVSNITIENCIIQNCFGAAIYNGFDGEFTFSDSLIYNVDGVGIYNNSSQGTVITDSVLAEIGLDGGQIYGVVGTPGRAQNQFHSGITGFGKTTGGQENLVVQRNAVFNIGYNGIRFDGANNTVQYNYVCAAMLELSDGGGIYSFGGNSSLYTVGCSVLGNIVIYCPGNLSATNKDLDRNLAEGIYLDNGNDTTFARLNFIAYAGGWGALSNFDNDSCSWEDNTFFGSDRYGLLTFDSTNPASNNNNNEVVDNRFVVWHPNHSPIISLNRTSSTGYEPVTSSDNNTFIVPYKQRPAHENVAGVGVTYTEWVNYGARYFKTLSQWQSSSSLDAASSELVMQKDFVTKQHTINDDTYMFVNFTGASQNITLSGSWYDVETGSAASFPKTVGARKAVLFIKQ